MTRTGPVDFGPATLSEEEEGLLVVRFKEGAVATGQSFLDSMNARRAYTSAPHAVLVIAPDQVEFDLAVLDKDHYADQLVDHLTLALAVVTSSPGLIRLLETYYIMHPAAFPTRILAVESTARAWLKERLLEVSGRRN